MEVLNRILAKAKAAPQRIVLCEGDDARVLEAGIKAAQQGIAHIILVGNQAQLTAALQERGANAANVQICDPATSAWSSEFAQALFELRKAKGLTLEQAQKMVLQPLCFANLMVRLGHADGSVTGAVHTTGDVVRSALQIIGMSPGAKLVSSFFLMLPREQTEGVPGGLIFTDCGLVVNPDAHALADIAMAGAASARALLMEEPRVAMLSFSTQGSAASPEVEKVAQATQLVRESQPNLAIDGEVQLDAAIVPSIAKRKLKDSKINGRANVLVFPTLDAGNIGYKLVERLGGAVALGPLLQGLQKPANDLSRGCSSDDVFKVIAITVAQAQSGKAS